MHGRSARVYAIAAAGGGTRVFGCAAGGGGPVWLGDEDRARDHWGVHTRPFALSGTWVAYGSEAGSDEGGHGLLLVRSLRNARISKLDQIPGAVDRIAAVVLSRHGALAWIDGGALHVQVATRPRVIERGPGLEPASLRLRHGWLRWRSASGSHALRLR